MRRKPGALLPNEESILIATIKLWRTRVFEFHGYQIARHVAEESERRSLTAYGTLYRALARLEKMGLLKSRWEDPQIAADETRPGRRLYVLTSEGLAAAQAATRAAMPSHAARRRRRRIAPA